MSESFAALFEESLKRAEMRIGEVITAEVIRVEQLLIDDLALVDARGAVFQHLERAVPFADVFHFDHESYLAFGLA